MNDRLIDRQKNLEQVGQFLVMIKRFIQNPVSSDLQAVAADIRSFSAIAETLATDSFNLISRRLQKLFDRHLLTQTVLSPLELETVELAVDWLDQLFSLYKENLPEPRSLVKELLYTFDLVERSQGAVTLGELLSDVSNHTFDRPVDPFKEDPEPRANGYASTTSKDPFAEDPGFGMEFDLLQRTLNRATLVRVDEDDPFSEDPAAEVSVVNNDPGKTLSGHSKLPFDVFAGDPSVEEKSDQD